MFLLAPKDNAPFKSTRTYVKQLIFGPYSDIEPYIICVFAFMGKVFVEKYLSHIDLFLNLGIWPMIYLTILLVDGQYQKLNGTLAALLANVLGALIILPYFALRRSEKAKEYRMNIFIRMFEWKITPILLMITTIGVICYGLLFGNSNVFMHEFQTNWFIHCMTLDFFILSFIFPFLIEDDLKRRQMFDNKQWTFYFRLCFIPMIGPSIYFYRRKSLKQANH